jgi:hypothetical protein
MRALIDFLRNGHTMNQHPVLEALVVAGVNVGTFLTSQSTLTFLSICFIVYRFYLAWKHRNNPPKDG